MNLTTLEQSKQLKAWGAPQNTDKFWYEVPAGQNLVDSGHMGLPNPDSWYAAYDLESLIGWLGEDFEILRAIHDTHQRLVGWRAYYHPKKLGDPLAGTNVEGNTPLQAVYALAEAIHGKEGE